MLTAFYVYAALGLLISTATFLFVAWALFASGWPKCAPAPWRRRILGKMGAIFRRRTPDTAPRPAAPDPVAAGE